jgi:hypothetical protein
MDHSGFNEWKTLEEVIANTPMIVETVGWVIKETDDAVYIVSTLEIDGDRCHSDLCIVKDAIHTRIKIQ